MENKEEFQEIDLAPTIDEDRILTEEDLKETIFLTEEDLKETEIEEGE